MPKKIMIFDDDKDLLEVCGIVLRSRNYEVMGMSKCDNIVQEVRAYNPDVILMDNKIPEEGGVKATQELKKDPILKSIPVIFFSANDHVEYLSTDAGAEFFLRKPFELDELEQIVSRGIRLRLALNV
jgi:CheY-like chemotaxis protein